MTAMKTLWRLYRLMLCLLCGMSAVGAQAVAPADRFDIGRPQSVGLVLSGGGAKGIAHIGVIKALEEANIPIDYITGTSMGAIVGGLYAAGYTPEEMLELILSKDFSYWSTGKINPALTYSFIRPEPTPAMLTFNIGGKDTTTSAVPASLISPLPMNFAFMELFSATTAACHGDFNRLMIPFRCVASNVDDHCKEVLASGSLGDAIRASMSFPAVFQPTRINGKLLYDGGIYDNFPVDVMRREFAPDIMIGVVVASSTTGPQTSLIDQIENLVVQNTDYSLPADEGIRMRLHLERFGLLDFAKAREIYRIGYDYAQGMIDSISRRVTSRMSPLTRRLQRATFKSQIPYLRFDSVTVTGANEAQNRYLAHLFEAHRTDTFGVVHAREAFYEAVSSGKLRDLSMQARYNPATDLFSLHVGASVKNDFKVGLGGWITSSNNSYLYLSGGYSRLSFKSLWANAGVWVGQSYMAGMFDGRIFLPTKLPASLGLLGVVSRSKYNESDRFFFQESLPTFVLKNEYFGRLRLLAPAGRSGIVEIGVGGGHLYDSFYADNTLAAYQSGRRKAFTDLGQVSLRLQANTLSAQNFPTAGYSYDLSAMGLLGRYRQNDNNTGGETDRRHLRWLQFNARGRQYLDLAKHWSLGFEGDVMLSTRSLLPDYNASLVAAPEYMPTPSAHNTFNPSLRAFSYVGAGVVPVYKYNQSITARVSVNGFMPLRAIRRTPTGEAEHARWMRGVRFFAEALLCYEFPFATLNGYVNYTGGPDHVWNAGIAFGVFLQAPSFLR